MYVGLPVLFVNKGVISCACLVLPSVRCTQRKKSCQILYFLFDVNQKYGKGDECVTWNVHYYQIQYLIHASSCFHELVLDTTNCLLNIQHRVRKIKVGSFTHTLASGIVKYIHWNNLNYCNSSSIAGYFFLKPTIGLHFTSYQTIWGGCKGLHVLTKSGCCSRQRIFSCVKQCKGRQIHSGLKTWAETRDRRPKYDV